MKLIKSLCTIRNLSEYKKKKKKINSFQIMNFCSIGSAGSITKKQNIIVAHQHEAVSIINNEADDFD